MKYGSYPRNTDFNDLPIEYEQFFLTKQTIDRFADNIEKFLNVRSIERQFDNRIYESNPQNDDFNNIPFDGSKRYILYKL